MDQQAWILRSLLVELERQEAADDETLNGIAAEFARLKSQSTKYRTDKTYPTKTAEKQENIKKNRYKDIVPFDHSRVKLTFTTTKNDTDYINASFIKGVSGSRAYIATQGPLPHTVLDFLRMLWEYNIQVVVMACREFEMGKKKCERYWPQKQEQPFVCEPFTVYCDSEESRGDYLTRMLRITYRNSSRTLKQLHYVNWPDHGVPDSIPPILEMLHEMRSYQAHDDIPICIHCSAGCGRTGALCAIDYTWNLLKKQMISLGFNIYDLVQNMRTQRPSVVQTKEQYELVYRTIKLLFQRHLQSMDAQTSRNEVTMVPSAITPDAEHDLLDLSDELELMPQFQNLLDEERDVLAQYHTSLPFTSENHIALTAKGELMEQQQWQHAFSDTWATTQNPLEGPRTSPKLVHVSQRAPAVQESIQESDDIPSLNPPPAPAVAEAICLMVEDPYFDNPMSSPSSDGVPMNPSEDAKQWTDSPIFSKPLLCLNEQTLEFTSPVSGTIEAHTDEDEPPPLPERTPESYVLAVDTEHSDPCERLSVIIPPNAAAEAVRELGGSPPSPVPPLPERTPESFELAIDQAPVEQNLEVRPAVNLNRIGMSSEWSGNSKPAANASDNETKPWVRSKSLKANLTFKVTAPGTHLDLTSNTTSNLHPIYPPLDQLTPSLLSHSEDSLTPPLPDRTPDSFIPKTEETVHEETALCPLPLETTQPSPRVGMSSEWDGTSQPKKFLDVVMTRSKTVRAKSSKQEPLIAVRQLAPPPVVVAGAGSAQVGQHDVNHRSSMNAETPGNKSDKSNEKGMSRTKSLKFFRHKQKPKIAPPPPPDQPGTPPPTYGASFSVFKFGFGNRFGKPKGPRSYPETWI
ncbi:tyrosine-protein phosphatase non-receptor type 22 isoform X1 [Lates calcarifer]|uniref:protein-tyrosine-phosphatase n=1 Tax=Lates calcarifer TaxID=8187 RepID=A0A4W6FMW1_LATCA|nr:tyrosine-protein phosphatase non-receptor type 22 isoform X1 [Lates calcarifer]XP_050927340.1 tyrosine-protein phosphatase non-receptor type 22 isoform X1 [Lates calcarifer]